jgi:hypothetical protein
MARKGRYGGGGSRTRVRSRTEPNVYKLSPPFRFARRPEDRRPTAGLAILKSRASDDWLFFGASPLVDTAAGPRAQLGAMRRFSP